jgi:flagellar hook-length control protein FliK
MWAIVTKFLGGASGYIQYALYAALAGLSLTVYVQHKTNHAMAVEESAIKTQLSTAQDANHSEQAAIVEMQSALASCQSQYASSSAAAAAAATTAEQTQIRLAQSLASSKANLKILSEKPSNAPLLKIDLNTAYPDVAGFLRNADAAR